MDLREWIKAKQQNPQLQYHPLISYDLGYLRALIDLSDFLDSQDDVIRSAEEQKIDALTDFYKGRE